MLRPSRGTILTGRLDHRTRCFSSLNANRTRWRCFSSSVATKLLAAFTIRAVAVCAAAALTVKQVNANTRMLYAVLIGKAILLFSRPRFVLHSKMRQFGYRVMLRI